MAACSWPGGLSLAVRAERRRAALPARRARAIRSPIVEAQRTLAPRVARRRLQRAERPGCSRAPRARGLVDEPVPRRADRAREAFEERRARLGGVRRRPRADDVGAGRVRSVFAPSADEWLLARIRERDPAEVALVTADRRLAERARKRGVEVIAPAAFLARCRTLG
jgi:hypothetical protein